MGCKTTFTLEDNSSFFQGFATFFDVTFSQCHRVVQFSTSPRCVTVLYCLLCLLYCNVVLYCAVLCCTVLYCTVTRCVPTHWSQTVFHLDDQFPLVEGEEVAGTFVMARNKKYSRELDMEIALRHVPGYEGDPITDVVKKFSLKL